MCETQRLSLSVLEKLKIYSGLRAMEFRFQWCRYCQYPWICQAFATVCKYTIIMEYEFYFCIKKNLYIISMLWIFNLFSVFFSCAYKHL